MKNVLIFILVLAITQPLIMVALLRQLHWPLLPSALTAFLVATLFAEYARRLGKDRSRL